MKAESPTKKYGAFAIAVRQKKQIKMRKSAEKRNRKAAEVAKTNIRAADDRIITAMIDYIIKKYRSGISIKSIAEYYLKSDRTASAKRDHVRKKISDELKRINDKKKALASAEQSRISLLMPEISALHEQGFSIGELSSRFTISKKSLILRLTSFKRKKDIEKQAGSPLHEKTPAIGNPPPPLHVEIALFRSYRNGCSIRELSVHYHVSTAKINTMLRRVEEIELSCFQNHRVLKIIMSLGSRYVSPKSYWQAYWASEITRGQNYLFYAENSTTPFVILRCPEGIWKGQMRAVPLRRRQKFVSGERKFFDEVSIPTPHDWNYGVITMT
jgi:transposase